MVCIRALAIVVAASVAVSASPLVDIPGVTLPTIVLPTLIPTGVLPSLSLPDIGLTSDLPIPTGTGGGGSTTPAKTYKTTLSSKKTGKKLATCTFKSTKARKNLKKSSSYTCKDNKCKTKKSDAKSKFHKNCESAKGKYKTA